MLQAAGPHIGFRFDHVISVQEAGYFKLHWKTYATACEIIGLDRSSILFVGHAHGLHRPPQAAVWRDAASARPRRRRFRRAGRHSRLRGDASTITGPRTPARPARCQARHPDAHQDSRRWSPGSSPPPGGAAASTSCATPGPRRHPKRTAADIVRSAPRRYTACQRGRATTGRRTGLSMTPRRALGSSRWCRTAAAAARKSTAQQVGPT